MERRFEGMDRRTFLKVSSMVAAGCAAAPGIAQEAKAPEPVYRTLGRTGLKVTVVSLGAMQVTESAVMQAAFDRGVNYVDTARGYAGGNNERVVGTALQGYRDKVLVGTKSRLGDKASILRSIEESLAALKIDYVDVLQLHNLSSRDQVLNAEAKEAMAEIRKQGKARFLGVTTHKNEVEILNAVVEDKFYDTVLVAYNFKSGPELKEAIAKAAKAGVGIIAMKTQAGGYNTKELGDVSPHQAALKWALQDENVSMAVPGMLDLAQVQEDIAVMEMMKLTQGERRILERYGQAIEGTYCHRCGECEPTCPLRVDIPTVNRCLMYAEGYRDLPLAKGTYRQLARDVSASACGQCSECVARCPRGIDIGRKMEAARQLFA